MKLIGLLKLNFFCFSFQDVTVEIGIHIEWSKDLRDKSSPAFRDLATKLENEVCNLFALKIERKQLACIDSSLFFASGSNTKIIFMNVSCL